MSVYAFDWSTDSCLLLYFELVEVVGDHCQDGVEIIFGKVHGGAIKPDFTAFDSDGQRHPLSRACGAFDGSQHFWSNRGRWFLFDGGFSRHFFERSFFLHGFTTTFLRGKIGPSAPIY